MKKIILIVMLMAGILLAGDLKVKQKKYELTGKYYGYIIEKVKDKEGKDKYVYRAELKSSVPLKDEEWIALWESLQVEPNEPEICPYCGRPM